MNEMKFMTVTVYWLHEYVAELSRDSTWDRKTYLIINWMV